MQLIVLPLFVCTINWILLGRAYWSGWAIWLPATGMSLVIFYLNWLINNTIANKFHKLFPYYKQNLKRIGVMLCVVITQGCLLTYLVYILFEYANLTTFQADRLKWGLGFSTFTVILISAVYEGVYAFEQWQRTVTETEQFKKANLESQFESLKQQINPHFLFNSLNTLSALIEDAPKQATTFLDEMSSVYRYLLRANESELTTLQTELDFAHSYFYLLRIRYGEGIQLVEAVDAHWHDYLIPPLTLQLLVENAVKHNVILPEQPLTIEVLTTRAGQLVVQNNLQRRSVQVVSERVGLTNITAKYRLLGQGEVLISEDDDYFRVTMPLLATSRLSSSSKH